MSDRGTGIPLSRRSPERLVARSPLEFIQPTQPPPGMARRKGVKVDGETRRMGGLLRFVNGLLTVLFLAMVATGALALMVRAQFDAPGPLEKAKIVVIPKGEGLQEIASRLEKEGVVHDRRVFVASYLSTKMQSWTSAGKTMQLKFGDYEFPAQATVRFVVERLIEGRTSSVRVTIREGLTSQQIVELLKSNDSLTGDIAQVPPEGSLSPETYSVARGSSRQAVLDMMLAGQRKIIERAWADRAPDVPFKTPEEAVILASIVEKETGKRDERERVASVFINRLRKGMRLQSDPTIVYGIVGGAGSLGRSITRADIAGKTPYNTYQIDGLPPGPICNPGRAAIEATLRPAKTTDLYFVADGTGGHTFSTNLKDHETAVSNWRRIERELRARQAAATGPAGAATDQTAPSPPSAAVPPATVAPKTPVPPAARGAAASPASPAPAAPAASSTAAEEATPPAATSAPVPTVPLPVRKPTKKQ